MMRERFPNFGGFIVEEEDDEPQSKRSRMEVDESDEEMESRCSVAKAEDAVAEDAVAKAKDAVAKAVKRADRAERAEAKAVERAAEAERELEKFRGRVQIRDMNQATGLESGSFVIQHLAARLGVDLGTSTVHTAKRIFDYVVNLNLNTRGGPSLTGLDAATLLEMSLIVYVTDAFGGLPPRSEELADEWRRTGCSGKALHDYLRAVGIAEAPATDVVNYVIRRSLLSCTAYQDSDSIIEQEGVAILALLGPRHSREQMVELVTGFAHEDKAPQTTWPRSQKNGGERESARNSRLVKCRNLPTPQSLTPPRKHR